MVNVAEVGDGLEEALGIRIVREEQIITYRQTISLTKKECVGAALAYLQERLHAGKVTGKVLCTNMGQGGITSVVTEQTGKIPIGSELEKMTDSVFQK